MRYLISNDPVVQRAREEEMLHEERLQQRRLAFREELESIIGFEDDMDADPGESDADGDDGRW